MVYKHGIGIELHYKNGPSYSTGGASYFSLDKCAVNSDVLVTGSCTDADTDVAHNTKLDNVGTLSITMKSPTTDACDPHVRMAYPKVLGLLDGNNSLYMAIDTAKGTDINGGATYDAPNESASSRCLDLYPTMPLIAQAKTKQEVKTAQMSNGVSLWTRELSEFVPLIVNYLKEQHDADGTNAKDEKLRLAQINNAIKNLDKDFPRFSEIRLIVMLLQQSESQADSMSEAHAKSRALQAREDWSKLLKTPLTIPNLAKLDGHFRATAPLTKSGNDCNAPLVLATTP
jgi:hypothetical protein